MTDRTEITHVLTIGQQLSNVAFNWAQNEGRVLTAADCAMLADVRRQWDEAAAALRTRLSTEEAGEPKQSVHLVSAVQSEGLTPVAMWQAINDEAECVVQGGKKFMLLTEEMCARLSGALEASAINVLMPRQPSNGMVYAGAMAWHEENGMKFNKACACYLAMVKEAEAQR